MSIPTCHAAFVHVEYTLKESHERDHIKIEIRSKIRRCTVETRLSVMYRTVEPRFSVKRLAVLKDIWKRWQNKIRELLQWNIYGA